MKNEQSRICYNNMCYHKRARVQNVTKIIIKKILSQPSVRKRLFTLKNLLQLMHYRPENLKSFC